MDETTTQKYDPRPHGDWTPLIHQLIQLHPKRDDDLAHRVAAKIERAVKKEITP